MPRHLAVKLHSTAEKIIKQGHPWIFSDSIAKINLQGGQAGDLAIVFSHTTNKVIAIGLYDPDSAVRIKVIHNGGQAKIDEAFFRKKIEDAFKIRQPLLKTNTNAYRLLFGENDGFPGLIADIYDRTGVIKLYSPIWVPYVKMIAGLVTETTGAAAIVLRLSRHLQQGKLPWREGAVLAGELAAPEVEFREYGVRFRTNVLLGHKTGFFLDHRENRHKIGQMAKGKTVLDVFAYAGGFTVHALAGGAKEVTSMDVSEQALYMAEENIKLNNVQGNHKIIVADAFACLTSLVYKRKKYDIVVIDPPSFSKREKEKNVAKKKYAQLAQLGVALTRKMGILMLASCSSRISASEFKAVHQSVFRKLGTHFTVEDFTQHDVDHPVRFPEADYLKTYYYRIG